MNTDQFPQAAAPEVIGVGALNVDYIAGASRLSERGDERVTESIARFDWNREGPVDEHVITTAIRNLGAASLSHSLGGSAWLSIFSLAQMRVGIRLAYIGILGRIETPGLSFIDQMDELGIAHDWVGRVPEQLCGLCLSYIDDTDRVMLTHPGANYEMHRYIRDNFDALAEYIATARYVHVTSFLDERTPGEILRLLNRAKQINVGLRISFDPGFDWAEHPNDAVAGILGLTDLLFLNYREFKALGQYRHGEADETVARNILNRCNVGCTVFVTKRYDFTESFQSVAGGVALQTFRLRHPLLESELEDATGAGDVFAAAVLSSLTSTRLKIELGAYLGLKLAQFKAVQTAPGEFALPDLSKGFLERVETLNTAQTPTARGVFLVHHESPYRTVVRRFIETDCGLPVYEMTSTDIAGSGFAALLGEQAPRCGFAVCLLGKTETMADGRARADQNVVYQAGFFQGKYGFGRVALLSEEGCEGFSNVAGLVHLDFPPDQVDATFIELRRMLKREGLTRARKRADVLQTGIRVRIRRGRRRSAQPGLRSQQLRECARAAVHPPPSRTARARARRRWRAVGMGR
jgi:sugar/nucleoside kinase (ribokinase family)